MFDRIVRPVTWIRYPLLGLIACLWLLNAPLARAAEPAPRERINIDRDWRFALGDLQDAHKDFGYGAGAFFFAKTGYGDGPASAKFDDRPWRALDLPHDWAIEAPFDPKADGNHGSHAVGPGFPQNDIGWYRKHLDLSEADRGKRISVEFDGVFRDATVWFNGFYIGEEHSGYSGFRYDLTDYVNYSGPNVLVVRVNVSTNEGWFYEGAGIYRHVWLTKTAPLHVAQWGVFVTTDALSADKANLTARAKIDNDDTVPHDFTIEREVFDAGGQRVADSLSAPQQVDASGSSDSSAPLTLARPKPWSIETPTLYRLVTTVRSDGAVVDRYETPFGVRTTRWDANTGFWLNGVNVKLKGVNLHQDFAGVGVAVPDALQAYRIERLKAMGANAIRTAHNPPSPEFLDTADRLGMLILDENRMMGTSPEVKDDLTRNIDRDRNHPSVILWSVGNEEWAIEGNDMGTRLTKLMQDYVHTLDPSRRTTVAISGGSGYGSSLSTEVMGFNYRSQHNVDGFHHDFPDKPVVMTEEGSTFATRGIYLTDPAAVHIAAYDEPQRPTNSLSIEQGWTPVAERPWMAGLFIWTGMDYRGEPTPFGWPAISSQFGMEDTTGLFKDTAYYLKSWWSPEPMVHILPHWNWPDRLGQPIRVVVDSNAEQVELFLNGASLGRQSMPRNGHLEWQVPYQPGTLVARGYSGGREVAADKVETTGPQRRVKLEPYRAVLTADGRDATMVKVSVTDDKGRVVPTGDAEVSFSVDGPARIIGVGDGDPGSHEADQAVDSIVSQPVLDWTLADGAILDPTALAAQSWRDPFRWYPPGEGPKTPEAFTLRGRFSLAAGDGTTRTTLFLPLLNPRQQLFVAGQNLTAKVQPSGAGLSVALDDLGLTPGEVEVVIVVPDQGAAGLKALNALGGGGTNIAFIQQRIAAAPWQRRLFNGYAQVVIEAADAGGRATIRASAPGLRPGQAIIQTVATK